VSVALRVDLLPERPARSAAAQQFRPVSQSVVIRLPALFVPEFVASMDAVPVYLA
jgi:hypothetical protein